MIIACGPQLRDLGLAGMVHLNQTVFEAISQHCTRLKRLTIWCSRDDSHITDISSLTKQLLFRTQEYNASSNSNSTLSSTAPVPPTPPAPLRALVLRNTNVPLDQLVELLETETASRLQQLEWYSAPDQEKPQFYKRYDAALYERFVRCMATMTHLTTLRLSDYFSSLLPWALYPQFSCPVSVTRPSIPEIVLTPHFSS
eukprot:TRINITY_DN11688_c0_g1_i1.p1 TRINITY_DN11688_c0_g1~~TRINITY_DN11688_c0_g1_i1.p1  ORF type:complete len:199 (+),score=21.15 TRINITY_DN11688_c0_g1_i1:175-771(+)